LPAKLEHTQKVSSCQYVLISQMPGLEKKLH
jgi:hypothetical protein